MTEPTPPSPAGSFAARLHAAVAANNSLLCVGLDPVPERMPASLGRGADAFARYCIEIVDATADLVSCYKPNLGFFAAAGPDGVDALMQVRAAIPARIPVILDAKTGDMGNTAKAYARAWFDSFGFDAVTVNPYLGREGLEPFLSYADKGVIVVCRTSNPASATLQELAVPTSNGATEPLYLAVARMVRDWSVDAAATLGLVVGANRPAELTSVRTLCPDAPILLPGIGAQGGDLAGSVRAGQNAAGECLMVSASRSIIYAGNGDRFAEAARAAAQATRDEINEYRTRTDEASIPPETPAPRGASGD